MVWPSARSWRTRSRSILAGRPPGSQSLGLAVRDAGAYALADQIALEVGDAEAKMPNTRRPFGVLVSTPSCMEMN